MKDYLEELYGEILKSNAKEDILISGASASRILFLIFAKIYNQIRLFFISILRLNPQIANKNIAIVLTNNQLRSVTPLLKDNYIAVRPYLDSAMLDNVGILYFSPLSYIVDFFYHFSYISRRRELSWKQLYNAFAYFYYYKSFKRLFSLQAPRSLTITNPSHPILRSAVIAAKELKIPTIYLPHANTSPLYPMIFTDYALLEGTDALDVYKFEAYTKKQLVGSPRLDLYKDIKPIQHEGINVLVAANLLDDMEKVKMLLKKLKVHQSTRFCNLLFRPHPNLIIDKKDIEEIGVEVVSSKETCLQSLQRSDVLISANSTIFFEAIYFPIRCYYYDFLKEGMVKDSYNLATFKFIATLNFDEPIDLVAPQIDKEESDRIDITLHTQEKSLVLLENFYNKFEIPYSNVSNVVSVPK